MNNELHVTLFFDGGCRPNPGRASSAAIIVDKDGETLKHVGLAHEYATNNFAEWSALRIGLEACLELGATHVNVRGDSKLVIFQAFHGWAINVPTLAEIHAQVQPLLKQFTQVRGEHISWKENAAADKLCNAILDGTYGEDGAKPSASPLEVSFVVTVRLSEAAAADTKRRSALRKDVATAIERALPLAGVTVTRYSH